MAQRIFDAQLDDDLLYNTVCDILKANRSDLDEPWPILDVYCDYYDLSVEIIISLASDIALDRDAANAILELGFNCIFESKGDVGIQWTKGSAGKCNPRDCADSETKALNKKYRNRLGELENQLEELKKDIKRITTTWAI